jgi:coproporphyrinogen III oxidase-like Fe-S oxidoreductase
VFVGGGTPTLVDPAGSADGDARDSHVAGAEVTVECNPDDVTDGDVSRPTVAAGVNRVSIGVQSMVPSVLAALGRTHQPDNVERPWPRCARPASPRSTSTSSTAARARRSPTGEHTLRRALALEPLHVSAYALTVEAGTPLADSRIGTPTTTTSPTSTSWPTSCSLQPGS